MKINHYFNLGIEVFCAMAAINLTYYRCVPNFSIFAITIIIAIIKYLLSQSTKPGLAFGNSCTLPGLD